MINVISEANHAYVLVPTAFITRYMPAVPKGKADYVKVMLTLYQLSQAGVSIEPKELVKLIPCSRKDLIAAFRYWEDAGLISLIGDISNPSVLSIKDLTKESFEEEEDGEEVSEDAEVLMDEREEGSALPEEAIYGKRITTLNKASRKALPAAKPEEDLSKDASFALSLQIAQTLLNDDGALICREMDTVKELYFTLDKTPELVESFLGAALEFADVLNEKAPNTPSRSPLDMVKKLAEEYKAVSETISEETITTFFRYKAFLLDLGFDPDIEFAIPAVRQVYSWLADFSPEMVKIAVEKAVTKIPSAKAGRRNKAAEDRFNYIRGLFAGWKEEGVTSPETLDAAEKAFKQAKKPQSRQTAGKPAAPNAGRSSTNRFHNFAEREVDPHELDNILYAYQKKEEEDPRSLDDILAPFKTGSDS